MSSRDVERVAEVLLYEGYLLFPYRHSALKNQQRWSFGGVYPRACSEANGGHDPWQMQTECLVRGDGATELEATLRFLHVIDVDDREQAIDRQFVTTLRLRDAGRTRTLAIRAEHDSEHRCRRLWGRYEVTAVELQPRLYRLTAKLSNITPVASVDRKDALHQSFVATHTILRVQGGEFVSLLDPPDKLGQAAASCRNLHTWPVLAGEPGDRHTMLSSPIILYDYPEVAPESNGNLFDTTEIDELLTLSVLALTDQEKREMRDADPRSRHILERTEALTEEQLLRLHGATRELR